jgi:ATP-dependent protease ClpP protease subunit
MIVILILLYLQGINCSLNSITLTNKNHVSIIGEINKNTVSKFIKDIQVITKPKIYIYINSEGGDVLLGHKIVQYMNYKKYQNRTLHCITDKALSMAFHIFQHCDERFVLHNTILMQHQMQLQFEISDTLENINNYVKMYNKINDKMIQIESNRIGMTQEQYKIKTMAEWWIHGKDAIKYRVADKLINAIGCNTELLNSTRIIIDSGVLRKESSCPLI